MFTTIDDFFRKHVTVFIINAMTGGLASLPGIKTELISETHPFHHPFISYNNKLEARRARTAIGAQEHDLSEKELKNTVASCLYHFPP